MNKNKHLCVIDVAAVRGERTLFSGLSFSLQSAEIVQISGSNGVGKTTLLRLLCGLMQPQRGDIRWEGKSIFTNAEEYRANIVCIAHKNAVVLHLTVSENLQLTGKLMQVRRKCDEDAVLRRVGLSGYSAVLSQQLSAGQRQRVALARLLLSDAPLWILDEPISALDETGVHDLQSLLIEHIQQGGMALMSTHRPLALPGVFVQQVALSA